MSPALLLVVLHAPAAELESLEHAITEVVSFFPELALTFRDASATKIEIALASDLDPPLINAEWFQDGAMVERSILESGKGRMAADVASVVRALIERRGFRMHGRLEVSTVPPNATVLVEPGVVAGTLMPGRYRIVASLSGHADAERTVELEAGEVLRVELSLRERSIVESPWLWTLIGVAVVGSAVAAGVLLQPEPTFTLCHRGSPEGCR
jgi:hypothetical protein